MRSADCPATVLKVFPARRVSALLVLFAVLACRAPLARGADDPAGAAAVTDTKIAEALRQLGDRDFRVREAATHTLWSAGKAAEPALRAALEGADPESARRIRSVLSNITYGITPDMSAEVIELMSRYRTGDAAAKWQSANALAERGAGGGRVLLKLWAEEKDPAVRSVVSRILTENARGLAAALAGDGDTPSAGRVLEIAATTPAAQDAQEQAAMDYAAFLLVAGGLDERIAAAKARLDKIDVPAPAGARAAGPDAASTAALLTFLCRANGDLPAAKAAAERSGSEPLQHNILIEAGDWPELARRADADMARADSADLCFAAAFHRLAGDDAGLDKLAAMLNATADREPDESWNLAEALLLNGRLDLGMDVLVRHNHLLAAVEIQAQRLAYDEVPALVERAKARGGPELGRVEAKAARARWFAGDNAAAVAALDATAKASERRRDMAGLVAAVEVAADMGLKDRVYWYTLTAMRVANGGPPLPNQLGAVANDNAAVLGTLFEKARFKDAGRAAGWAAVLRKRFPKQPAGRTLEMLRAIDEKRMPGDALQSLCDASAADAMGRPPEQRDAELELVADTLAAAGRGAAAAARYAELVRLTDQTSPARATAAVSKLAALDADAKRWQPAADGYLRAWSRDPENPVPLYLSGWALAKAGDASSGKERMERAHLVPLSDENSRHALYEALAERKLAGEATRERELILRTGAFLSWRRSEALRRAGDDAYAAGDATRAADLWERAFLDNNSKQTRFVESWANVSMPALIRRTRAVGLIRSGKLEAGIKQADACLGLSPGDADSLIEIVTALDSTGHKPEADALYGRAARRYAKLCESHPASGPLHNLYAWAAAKCRRELDAALTHARRAVELQPTNTASLDTLAEAHFQRGEFEQATNTMKKCAELEPDEPRHKEQLERFAKAAKK